MGTTAQTAALHIGKGQCRVYITDDHTYSTATLAGLADATLAYACNVLEMTSEVNQSLLIISSSGRLFLLVGVSRADKHGHVIHARCRRLLRIDMESPAPNAVLVAARMLGGMAEGKV